MQVAFVIQEAICILYGDNEARCILYGDKEVLLRKINRSRNRVSHELVNYARIYGISMFRR
uniref:Uncharacterized protein n=1 Tax=Oryza brachyantha TaxID=4533 RepID=J3N9X3_ORYBR